MSDATRIANLHIQEPQLWSGPPWGGDPAEYRGVGIRISHELDQIPRLERALQPMRLRLTARAAREIDEELDPRWADPYLEG